MDDINEVVGFDDFWLGVHGNSFTEDGINIADNLETAKRIAIWRSWPGIDEETWDLIEPHLAGHSVVDFGCGYGRLIKVAKSKGYYPTGVDVDIHMMDRFKEYIGWSPVHAGDWEHNLVDGLYDSIYSVEALQHIDEPVRSRVLGLWDRATHVGSTIIIIGEPHASMWAKIHDGWELTVVNDNCLPSDIYPRYLTVFRKMHERVETD